MYEPVYVIAGKEEALVSIQCKQLLDELLEPEQRTMGLFDADPAAVSGPEVLDELRTAPFLTKRRVVLVRNADKFVSENRTLLEKYFDKTCPTGVLVLTVSSWPGQTKLARKLAKCGKLISITPPKRWQLPGRIIEYAGDAYDKNLSKQAAELLIELVGEQLGQLYSEIDKLALFADNGKSITAQHIESLIGHNRLFNAFAVIDAIIDNNAAKAVGRLRRMFAEDKSAEYTVVGTFAFHLRRMFNAKVMLEKGSSVHQTASSLRIWGNKSAFFAQLHKMTLGQVGSILQQLAGIDYAIKTGQTKPQVAIEQLVLKLTAGQDMQSNSRV